ncbi:MAG: glycogen debranching enzyme N-terminal domain-containing protein [Gemmataceae bacterium]|nr:glycogen debranching enzyme N-terminal domain-containing protein [Gemmataceae bacterium]
MWDEVRTKAWKPGERPELAGLLEREWLVTNGLGGYASGTICGAATRRYHGLLIAAHPAPLGRVMMVNHLWEYLRLPDYRTVPFGGEEKEKGDLRIHGAEHLEEFHLEAGLPVWRYQVEGFRLEKRIYFAYRHNTSYVQYRLLSGAGKVRLKLRPSVHFRGHDDPVTEELGGPYTLTAEDGRYEMRAAPPWPALRMTLHGGANAGFTFQPSRSDDIIYRVEESRGYQYEGALWSPGQFRLDLEPGQEATLVLSTEPWESITAIDPATALADEIDRRKRLVEQAAPAARSGFAAELVLAADQFVFTPAARAADRARARAHGDEARSVIAGYHWFTDWGRDTMISLEGLTLCTGRGADAGYILRTFAQHIKDGLIPNLFPEKGQEGLYHTADATPWYFHALKRYLDYTDDRATLRALLPKLRDIFDHHVNGTRFGIGVDPADGLLKQGQEGYQLTWMDAKMGDFIPTPRRGKAVEINALWYNAVRLLQGWVAEEEGDAAAGPYREAADRCREAFNRRFWYAPGGHLYDVVDTPEGKDDPACRPNQVFAVSLDHPVLDEGRWRSVVGVVKEKLLTPVGLRSLAPGSPEYKAKYFGDLRSRDAAYHQGTVWGWLIGPFVDAWVKTYPEDRAGASALLDGFRGHMSEACVGSISEIFDAETPYTPRGCIAQAWSVAEVLRCLMRTAG